MYPKKGLNQSNSCDDMSRQFVYIGLEAWKPAIVNIKYVYTDYDLGNYVFVWIFHIFVQPRREKNCAHLPCYFFLLSSHVAFTFSKPLTFVDCLLSFQSFSHVTLHKSTVARFSSNCCCSRCCSSLPYSSTSNRSKIWSVLYF